MRLILLFMAVSSMSLASCGKHDESLETAGSPGTVAERPVAIVTEKQAAAEDGQKAGQSDALSSAQPSSANTGESVYTRACVGCHLTGAAGAPKLGDKAAWSDRVARGEDALVQSVINGVPGTAMLARGTCNACTDEDLKAAVAYMISQSR